MSFFLFIKQFVDMLYPYQILDYGMVILVILLLAYQIALGQTGFPQPFQHYGCHYVSVWYSSNCFVASVCGGISDLL